MKNDIDTQVKKIIAALAIIPNEINNISLLSELGIDSLAKAELIIELEDEFNIEFQVVDLEPSNLNTVLSIINLVKKYIDE